MPLYYNASDCLIVASAYEGSPNVVKEALACNCPVVSSKVGDVEERLRDVYPSMVVGRNPQELGIALAEVLALNTRSNGRENITELSLERVTRRLIQLYNEVLEKETVPDKS
jgi:glycosyltransferase involved in cell wall biosynthesis